MKHSWVISIGSLSLVIVALLFFFQPWKSDFKKGRKGFDRITRAERLETTQDLQSQYLTLKERYESFQKPKGQHERKKHIQLSRAIGIYDSRKLAAVSLERRNRLEQKATKIKKRLGKEDLVSVLRSLQR